MCIELEIMNIAIRSEITLSFHFLIGFTGKFSLGAGNFGDMLIQANELII